MSKNKKVVTAALRENKGLVAIWLKSHRDLIGIFLQGDVHPFVHDLVDAKLHHGRSGDGYLEVEALGSPQPIRVDFAKQHAPEFTALVSELNARPEGQNEST